MSVLDGIAIVGVAETAIGKLPGRSAISLQAEAGVAAVAAAGLTKDDIDGVFSFSGYSQAMMLHAARVAEHLGLRPELAVVADVGGPGTHHAALLNVAAAIDAGMCTAALCTYGENGISIRRSGRGRAPGTLTGGEDFEAPYGQIAMITGYALFAQRHMHLYGTTSEQLGAVAVASRHHASLNDNAHKRESITLADHQASPMISSPLRRLDCSLISDAGGAFVVTSVERAGRLGVPYVRVLGYGSAATHHIPSQAPDLHELGGPVSARRAFERAGLTVADADAVYIHDACTFSVVAGVEALGLCGEGEGGPYAESARWPWARTARSTCTAGCCRTATLAASSTCSTQSANSRAPWPPPSRGRRGSRSPRQRRRVLHLLHHGPRTRPMTGQARRAGADSRGRAGSVVAARRAVPAATAGAASAAERLA